MDTHKEKRVRVGDRVTLGQDRLVRGTVTALWPDGTVRVNCSDGETRDVPASDIR